MSKITKKKFLIVTDVTSAGGVDTYVKYLTEIALRNSYQVVVLLNNGSHSNIPQILDHNCELFFGKIYHRIYDQETIIQYFKDFIKNIKPSLVHVVCGAPWSCLVVREQVLLAKLPLVFTEQYVPYDIELDEKLKVRLKNIYLNSWQIIFVDKLSKTLMLKEFKIDKLKNVNLIYNFIEIDFYYQQRISLSDRLARISSNISQRKIKILYAGRLVMQKGVDILITALAKISSEDKDLVELHIYGEGSEQDNIKSLVIKLDITNLVKFFPFSSNVIKLFAEYDLFVLPSRSEGLPFILLEAMACGIPCIISNIPPHLKVSQNGKFCHVFDIAKPASLTNTLINWINEPCQKITLYSPDKYYGWLVKNFDIKRSSFNLLNIWSYKIGYNE